ncbi:MAG TPA: DUF58 domain-containing protein [Streptosporangiaceae bacterium]|nr:DUF58 domain-containing protein [Streptosporangiaceae bacterium]
MALTRRAVLAALVAVVAVLAVPALGTVLVANGLLLGAVLADLTLAGAISPLLLSRSGDTSVLLGESAAVTTTITNQGRRVLVADIRDSWQPSAGATPHHSRVRLTPGGTGQITTRLTPGRRGDKTAARLTVRSLGPLGLAARQAGRAAPWTVRVLPPFPSRRHLPEKLSRLRQFDGQHRSLHRGQGSEFDSLREYVVGDDVRSIDWRATARRRDVMVRTWRPERDRRILAVLDTGRTSAGRVGGYPRLDAAMDATLLLTALASRAGDRIDMIAFDRRIRARVIGASRPAALSAVAHALATVEPELVETNARGLVSAALSASRHRSLIVLLTDLNPAAMEEGLLPRVPLLAARHQVVVAAVTDPTLQEMAASHDSAEEVYDAAAAQQALAGRQRVSSLLQRHGVTVVDAPPGRFAVALADAYLGLKAAGRL